MTQIIPAILATTEEEYKEKLSKIEQSETFLDDGWIQIDLMDNKFVQNQSIDWKALEKYPAALKIEAHLMVVDPYNWILPLKEAGVNRIIFHLEAGDPIPVLERIKNEGLQVGIAINPETEVEKLVPFMNTIEVVLLMSVHPGFGGQEFIPETLEKVKETSRIRSKNNFNFLIEVDGGVSEKVAKDLVEDGVDNLVIGSHLLEGDIDENVEKIWDALS